MSRILWDAFDGPAPPPPAPPAYEKASGEMAFDRYQPLGKWRVASWTASRGEVSFLLREWKSRLEIELPKAVYAKAETANEASFVYKTPDEAATGKPVPIGFGQLYRVPAVCVDLPTRRFKLFGHACNTIQAAYLEGDSVALETVDTTKSEFTIPSWDADKYGDTPAVTADCRGYVDGSGNYLTNPADVIAALLTTWAGEPSSSLLSPAGGDSAEGTGFGEHGSRTKWVIGTTRSGAERHEFAAALYLSTARPALEVIEELAAAAGATFRTDASGLYVLQRWCPQASEGLPTFRDADILECEREISSEDAVTKAVGRFAFRQADDAADSATAINPAGLLHRALPSAATRNADLPLSERDDALEWAQRTVFLDGEPFRVWRLVLNQRAMLLEPGDCFALDSRRWGSGVLEVLEVRGEASRGTRQVRACDQRGARDRCGYWTDDSPTFPARLGGGAASPWSSAWTAEQKAWARQNLGYWTDDHGFADPADPDSYLGSVWL